MPIIATKVITVSAIAVTTIGSAVGGYFARDDISQTAVIAAEYVEVKTDRHTGNLFTEVMNEAKDKRFSNQGGNF